LTQDLFCGHIKEKILLEAGAEKKRSFWTDTQGCGLPSVQAQFSLAGELAKSESGRIWI